MNESLRPTAEDAIRLFRHYFLNRIDFVAILAPWRKPCPVEANGTLDALIAAHVLGNSAPQARVHCTSRNGAEVLEGRFRIGSYAPAPDQTTRWLCLDFDGKGHEDALADPLAAAIATLTAMRKAGLVAHLERSGGGEGWHVWLFFDAPIPAANARALGLALAPKDVVLAAGGVADPEKSKGIEVFPKSKRIAVGAVIA
jgi:hypothetical protein